MPTLEELGVTRDSLFATHETVTVELFEKTSSAPAIWVTFKKSLEYGQKLDLDASLFAGMSRDEALAFVESDASVIKVNLAKQKKNKLVMMIQDWNLPGPGGKTITWPTKYADRIQVLSSLDSRVGEYLEEKADELLKFASEVAAADPNSDEAEKNPLARPAVVA